jgi:hypothetical protein
MAHFCWFLPWFLGLVGLDLSGANPVCNCLGFLSRLIWGCRGLFRRVFALVFRLGWYNNIRVCVSRYFPWFSSLDGPSLLGPDSISSCLWFWAWIDLACQCPFRWVVAFFFSGPVGPNTSRIVFVCICLEFRS